MTHSPVTDQLEEFWSLIKGQGVKTVVMLTPQSDQMFQVNELLKLYNMTLVCFQYHLQFWNLLPFIYTYISC